MITKIVCDKCGVDGCNQCRIDWDIPENINYHNWKDVIPSSEKGSAKEYGWKYCKGKDVCPKCLEEKDL